MHDTVLAATSKLKLIYVGVVFMSVCILALGGRFLPNYL